jgi:hypothetical protein
VAAAVAVVWFGVRLASAFGEDLEARSSGIPELRQKYAQAISVTHQCPSWTV